MLRSFTTLIVCFVCFVASAQTTARKTFVITASGNSPLVYNRISAIDLSAGKSLNDLFESSQKKYAIRDNGYKSYQKSNDREESRNRKDDNDDAKSPLGGGSVACMAYDAKSNRLFYVPLQLSELRYMDLKESEPSFTCLQNQSLNLLHSKDDVANQITRMSMGADGFGYALSNDGEHLVKFSTNGTPVIQDLGVLIDNPKNQVLVRSSCTSWGGDMVGAADGSLYLITLHNHVFRISLPSKKCDYVGTIKNLPEEFTSNGASVNENGELMISCGTSYGKKFSPVYKVSFPSLEATAVNTQISGLGNIADMASSNLLFEKASSGKKATETGVSFTQTIEMDDNNLPSISIFPNPITRGKFQIKASNLKERGDYKMMIVDVAGKPIMEGKMNIGTKTSTHSFNFPAQYAKGVYFLQIADVYNRTMYSQQLIVE